VISILSIILIRSALIRENAPVTRDQIKIDRGDDYVIVNRNGLIEYHTSDNIFYETWDSSKIGSFFSTMEVKARDYQSKGRGKDNDCHYKVTMYLNGKLVVICVSKDDLDINDVYNELDDKYNTPPISDYFSPDDGGNGSGGDGDLSDVDFFPSPTPYETPIPTPTTAVGGGNESNYPPVKADCDTWSSSIVRNRAIISNTYCVVANPTVTP
jgi:hypothetical protein